MHPQLTVDDGSRRLAIRYVSGISSPITAAESTKIDHFEDMIAAISTGPKRKRSTTPELPSRAVALREALRDKEDLPLTPAERDLMAEWLNRLADSR